MYKITSCIHSNNKYKCPQKSTASLATTPPPLSLSVRVAPNCWFGPMIWFGYDTSSTDYGTSMSCSTSLASCAYCCYFVILIQQHMDDSTSYATSPLPRSNGRFCQATNDVHLCAGHKKFAPKKKLAIKFTIHNKSKK